MFYLGLLVLPCTHTEGPRSPGPVGLFTLNHRVFRPFVGDCRPSFKTVIPRSGPSSFVPDPRPSFRTVVLRSGPSSFVLDRRPLSFDPLWHIYSKSLLDVLDSYPTLHLSSLCLSIYHTSNLLAIDSRLACDDLQQKFQDADYFTCDPLISRPILQENRTWNF